MEKKNTGLIFVIVILTLVVGLLGGYIIANKLIDKQPNQTENNDNKASDISITEAEKIMNKYMINLYGEYYIDSLENNMPETIAIKNTLPNGKINCEELKKEDTRLFTDDEIGSIFTNCTLDEFEIYSYDDVYDSYEKMFGVSKSIDKQSFKSSEFVDYYYYYKQKDSYVKIPLPIGLGCYNGTVGIKDVEVTKDNLTITAYNFKVCENNVVSTYKYIFKIKNNNYYLIEITEVK